MKYLRSLTLCAASALLTGCGVSAYLVPNPFDAQAYGESVRIAKLAQFTAYQCAQRNEQAYADLVKQLDRESEEFSKYEWRKNGYLKVGAPATQIRILVLEFTERQPATETYCHIKLSHVRRASIASAGAFGMPGAYNYCSTDFYGLWGRLKKANTQQDLKDYELLELSIDLAKLGKVNAFACSVNERRLREEFVRDIERQIPLML